MKLLNYFNVSLGKWLGIPVTLHWTWVLLLFFLLYMDPFLGLVYAGLFVIVLMHEFGHCLAAMYYKIVPESVTLYPIGGVARMHVSYSAKEEFVVTVCGPLVNLVLVPVLFFVFSLMSDESMGQVFWGYVSYVNLVMLIFNLLPIFPMDGGRILRSLLLMQSKDRLWSTTVAGRIGQASSIAMMTYGIFTGMFMLAIIGLFLISAAQTEIDHARSLASLKSEYRSVIGTEPTNIRSNHDVLDMIDKIQARLQEMTEESENR